MGPTHISGANLAKDATDTKDIKDSKDTKDTKDNKDAKDLKYPATATQAGSPGSQETPVQQYDLWLPAAPKTQRLFPQESKVPQQPSLNLSAPQSQYDLLERNKSFVVLRGLDPGVYSWDGMCIALVAAWGLDCLGRPPEPERLNFDIGDYVRSVDADFEGDTVDKARMARVNGLLNDINWFQSQLEIFGRNPFEDCLDTVVSVRREGRLYVTVSRKEFCKLVPKLVVPGRVVSLCSGKHQIGFFWDKGPGRDGRVYWFDPNSNQGITSWPDPTTKEGEQSWKAMALKAFDLLDKPKHVALSVSYHALARQPERGGIPTSETLEELAPGCTDPARVDSSTDSTALFHAARLGDLTRVKAMLAKLGAGVKGWRPGVEALIRAAQAGHGEVVEALHAAGVDIDAVNSFGRAAIAQAASFGYIRLVDRLLQMGARAQLGEALLCAASGGHTEIIRLLLNHGVPVDSQVNSFDAVWLAAQKGHAEALALLLKQGATANTPGPDGRTAFILSLGNGHRAVVETLVRAECQKSDSSLAKASNQALMLAVCRGSPRAVQEALESGADVNCKTAWGITPLMISTGLGDAEVVSKLLNAGADPGLKTRNDETAAWIAADARNARVMKLLIAAKADTETSSGKLGTPLMRAAAQGATDVVRCLAEAVPDSVSEGDAGGTGLWAAAHNGHLATVRLLLSYPATAASRPTALAAAAKNGHLPIVRALLQRGVDANSVCDDGEPALVWAIRNGHWQVTRCLVKAGADVSVKDTAGKSAMDWAKETAPRFVEALEGV